MPSRPKVPRRSRWIASPLRRTQGRAGASSQPSRHGSRQQCRQQERGRGGRRCVAGGIGARGWVGAAQVGQGAVGGGSWGRVGLRKGVKGEGGGGVTGSALLQPSSLSPYSERQKSVPVLNSNFVWTAGDLTQKILHVTYTQGSFRPLRASGTCVSTAVKLLSHTARLYSISNYAAQQ